MDAATTKHGRHSARTPGCAGAASLEALLVLPVLMLVFSLVSYVYSRYSAKQQAQSLAQSCAWRASAANCRSVPADCDGLLAPHKLSVQPALAPASQLVGIARDVPPLNLIGELLELPLRTLVGPALRSEVTRTATRASGYGYASGSNRQHARVIVSCNLEPVSDLGGVVRQFWGGLDSKLERAEEPQLEPVPLREEPP